MNNLNDLALLRVSHIIGDKKKGIPAILPISRSAWQAGVKSGKYPQPVRLGPKTTCWKAADIRELLDSLTGVAA